MFLNYNSLTKIRQQKIDTENEPVKTPSLIPSIVLSEILLVDTFESPLEIQNLFEIPSHLLHSYL